MKKIFSIITAAAIAISILPSAIAYASDELYSDYIPTEEIPANIIPVDETGSPTRTYAKSVTRNTADVTFTWDTTWSSESGFYEGATVFAEKDIQLNPSAGVYGLVFKNVVDFDPDTSYVFMAKVKSVGTKDVRLTMTLSNERADSIAYAAEYGKDGKLIGTEAESFSATILPSSGYSNESGRVQSLILGFAPGTESGASFHLDTSEKESIYIAPEKEYDIKTEVLSDSADICQGGKFNVKSEVLNQAGSKGNLKQHFTWKVLSEDKTEEASGFTIDGNGTDAAEIYAEDDTPTGKYNVVAISDDYEGFIKSAEINLGKKRIADIPYTPDSADVSNLILVPQTSAFAVRTDKNQINATAEDEYYTVSAVSDIESGNCMGMEGLRIQTVLNKGFASDFHFTPGKTYTVSARVRKSASSTEDNVYFNVSLGQGTEETLAYTDQYGDKGMLLADEWQDYKATVTVSENYDTSVNKKLFYLGMPNGTPQGAAFDIEYSVYIGENTVSKFECRLEDETDILTLDNSLTFYSAMTNQIGLADEKYEIDRYIINAERNEYITDFLTNLNGEMFTVWADAITKAGKYYFVAETTANGEVVRSSVPFTVEKSSVSESVADIFNSQSAEEIAPNMQRYIDALDIDFMDSDKIDTLKTAKLIKAKVNVSPIDKNNESELIGLLKKAMVISLYMSNSENEDLFNEDGTFKYAEELAPDSIDTNGITVYKLFLSDASNDARLNVQKELSDKDYESIDKFEKAFSLSVILNTLYKPGVDGSGYVEKLLTAENAAYAELEISAYLNASNKSPYNLELARKLFTKTELEEKIKKIKSDTQQSGNSGGSSKGSGGGSSGGGNKTPSVSGTAIVQNPQLSPISPFSDVDNNHWAFADIYALQQRGIISGNENSEFEPESELTREQFVKMICILMNLKSTGNGTEFSDTKTDSWYFPYISAATENGIITGIGDDKFGVGEPISRQDICVIIYRACKGDSDDTETAFADSDTISDYALNAVAYMASVGIVNGFEDNTFRANDNCTKAQAAKILSSVINLKGLVNQ